MIIEGICTEHKLFSECIWSNCSQGNMDARLHSMNVNASDLRSNRYSMKADTVIFIAKGVN